MGFPGGAGGKEPACQCRRCKRLRFDPWVGKIPWGRAWQPTLVFLCGESQGQRSLAGYSPWGRRRVRHNSVTKQQWDPIRIVMLHPLIDNSKALNVWASARPSPAVAQSFWGCTYCPTFLFSLIFIYFYSALLYHSQYSFGSFYLEKSDIKNRTLNCCCLVAQSCLFATSWTAARQASLSFTISRSSLKQVHLSRRCHPTISSFVVPFSCLPSFPASGSFPMSQLFASGGQSTGASAPASVLPVNTQD